MNSVERTAQPVVKHFFQRGWFERAKMTEQEWLESEDPKAMFHFLQTGGKGKDSGTTLAGFPVVYSTPHSILTERKAEQAVRVLCKGCERINTPIRDWISILASVCESSRCDECLPKFKQANLLRCIFGNPFTNPANHYTTGATDVIRWLSWHDGLIPSMAQSIYEEEKWNEMPILADALEEARCQDEQILNHLRKDPLHARGCFVIDLLLSEECDD